MFISAQNSKNSSVEIANCYFHTESAFLILNSRQTTGRPLAVNMHDCLIESNHVVTIYQFPAYPVGGRPSNEEMRSIVKKLLHWTEKENVYRRKISYLATWARNRPQVGGDIEKISDWLAFWKLKDSASIEGEFKFSLRPDGPRGGRLELEKIENPSGKLPGWLKLREGAAEVAK